MIFIDVLNRNMVIADNVEYSEYLTVLTSV